MQISTYYDICGRYEFTIKPLSYYERRKIKIKLGYNAGLDELDNCKVIKIGNRYVTKYITKLDLSYKNLTNLPSSIWNLKLLTNLYLHENPISILPSSIGKLKLLKYLIISYTNLTNLPSTIGNLKSLMTMDITNNKLTGLPLSMGDLKSLKELYLYGNQLKYDHLNDLLGLLPNCKICTKSLRLSVSRS